MKLSKRGEYALRALIDLGMARDAGRELLQAKEIAEKENIPIRFLEQIMIVLRGAGIVATRRGKEGGYYLNRPSDAISMGTVVRLIEGPLAPIRCVSQTAYEKCSCPDEEHCGLRMLMLDVRNAIARILDKYTLADVVEITTRKLKRDGLPSPFSELLGISFGFDEPEPERETPDSGAPSASKKSSSARKSKTSSSKASKGGRKLAATGKH